MRKAIGEAFKYAWVGAHKSRNEIYIQIGGGFLLWGVFIFLGRQMTLPTWISENQILNSIVQLVLWLIAAQVAVFFSRLIYWPLHLRGGILKIISNSLRKWGVESWHLIVGGLFGVIVGLAFICAGLIWHFAFAAPNKPLPTNSVAAIAAPAPLPPLPPGATIRVGSQVFWVITQEYTPKEAEEILEALEDLDNFIKGKAVLMSADVYQLSIDTEQNLAQSGSPKDAKSKLENFDKTRIIPLFHELSDVLNKYPTHREDISNILKDNGSLGDLRKSINDFEAGLSVMPDEATPQLIKATTENAQKEFKKSIEKLRSWLFEFSNRVSMSKTELRFLINRRS